MWPFNRKKDAANQNCINVSIRCGYFKNKKDVDKALKKAFPFLTSKDIKVIHNVLESGRSFATFRMFVPGSYIVKKEPVSGIRSSIAFGTDVQNCNCRGWVSGTCCGGPNFDATIDHSVQLHGMGEEAFPLEYRKGRHIHSEGDALPIDREGINHYVKTQVSIEDDDDEEGWG